MKVVNTRLIFVEIDIYVFFPFDQLTKQNTNM